ncbi:MAG: META domain-containing protein [Timaviella obliquedivisa GSE-PSE-MK23-08B]|jgi:heat shock protein HslJ|nr:META domain-containing protein [Timaviella obliquedivisa GSE-PSE-MK23-08B]
MNPLLSNSLLAVGAVIAIEIVGVAAKNLAMAQPIPTETPILMAQSSTITGSWRLISMGTTAALTVPLQATELTANFEGDRVSGSGGCNRFTGSYETESNILSLGALASTRKACEESVMNQEAKYLAALQAAQQYEVNTQGELQIFYQTAQESGVLRFTSQTVRALW